MDKSFTELNKLFWDKNIKNGSMVIDGVKVEKALHRFRSNSGKSADWEVIFSWVDADGQKQVLRKDSKFAKNRFNDPDRNWGLPE